MFSPTAADGRPLARLGAPVPCRLCGRPGDYPVAASLAATRRHRLYRTVPDPIRRNFHPRRQRDFHRQYVGPRR